MDRFELDNLDDIRRFCLCELKPYGEDHFERDGTSGYIPKYRRVYFWKILKAGVLLSYDQTTMKTLNQCINDLYTSTPYSLLPHQQQTILELAKPIRSFLRDYTKEHFSNSIAYDKLTVNGHLKDDIHQLLKQSGAHSWTAYLSPVTEKIWVEGDITADDFLNNLPAEFRNFSWDFRTASMPKIHDE